MGRLVTFSLPLVLPLVVLPEVCLLSLGRPTLVLAEMLSFALGKPVPPQRLAGLSRRCRALARLLRVPLTFPLLIPAEPAALAPYR